MMQTSWLGEFKQQWRRAAAYTIGKTPIDTEELRERILTFYQGWLCAINFELASTPAQARWMDIGEVICNAAWTPDDSWRP